MYFARIVGIGDRLPEALGRGLDVDLEHLFHLTLQFLLESAEPGGPGFGVLAHPPVVDEPDRDGVQEVELLPTPPLGDDEAGLLQLPEVLHDPEARHRKPRLEFGQRLAVGPEELIEQAPPGRVGQRLEHLVHAGDDR